MKKPKPPPIHYVTEGEDPRKKKKREKMSSTKTYIKCPEKTLPCPWCKTTKKLEVVEEDWGFISNLLYYVICNGCGANGPTDHMEEKAIKKWNGSTI